MEQGLEADHHQATHFYHKSTGLRAVVGLTSALSIVGSLLIVLSYICFRDLRTKAREILTHISLMDLGVAVSNLVGIGVNFSHYYDDACHHKYNSAHHECNVSSLIDTLCVVQGAFATGFTIGSVLWTVCLAMYMYLLISLKGTREAKLFVKAAYVFCYLMPVGITVWLALTKRIGFSPYESSAWCGALFVLPHKKSDILAATFGYNLWIFLTFVLIPVLYISSHMYIRDEVKLAGSNAHKDRFLSALQKLDYKFLLVPVVFILLRIWSFFGDIYFVYCKGPKISSPFLARALMYLEGIGDSGQGVANAVLFVVFTKRVRDRFLCCWRYCWCRRKATPERTRLIQENRQRLNSASYSVDVNFTPSVSPRGSPYR